MECIFSLLCLFLEIEHLKNKSMFLSLFFCFSSCLDLFRRAASTDSSHLSFALILYWRLRSRGMAKSWICCARDIFIFLRRRFLSGHSSWIFLLGIFLRRWFRAPSYSVLTTFFLPLPTEEALGGTCFFGGGRGFYKVRDAWYAPGSSAGVEPLHRRTAARKIACGRVGLLWRGVAERRRRGSLDLGLSPSLQICIRRGAVQGRRLPATRMSSGEAMWWRWAYRRGSFHRRWCSPSTRMTPRGAM